MKKSCVFAFIIATTVMLAPLPVLSQTLSEEARAARARTNAQNFENNARQITLFDRLGKVLKIVGPRGIYRQPIFSPDGTRIAVVKDDLEAENSDIWIIDISGGGSRRITSNQPREIVRGPVWSPDGTQIAYVAVRNGNEGLYRNSSNGNAKEELLYQLPGAGINLTDWSMDGRFLNYFGLQLGGNILFSLPLTGERQPIEIARSESQILGPRLSPNSRFVVYRSNETGRNEIWVRSFAPVGGANAGKWQVSPDGGLGMMWWRRDGRELYYLAADRGVMAVEVNTDGTFEFGKPKLLFKLPDSVGITGTPGGQGSVSRDGLQVAFIIPPAPQRQQITVLDRQGKITGTVGEPGFYAQPRLSPDGTRVAAIRTDRDSGTASIWTFDMTSGRGTAVTNDANQVGPPLWSPDGNQILYASMRGSYTGIYRRASTGTGNEELLFRYTAGAGLNLTDVSPDGRFLTFTSGGVVFVVPMTGNDPMSRQAIEFSRDEFDTIQGRFSRDGRFMAYGANELSPGRNEVYVRPFDASSGAAGKDKWQVSRDGTNGMVHFREDGKELYWMRIDPRTGDGRVMAAEISAVSPFQTGAPRLLFTLPNADQRITGPGTISRDGRRFVFTMDMPSAK